jgi:hypothetical protein
MCKDKWNSLNSNYKIKLEQIIAKGQLIILICGIYHLKKKNVSIWPNNSIDNFISWLWYFKRRMLSMFFDILKMWIVKVTNLTYRQKKTYQTSIFMDSYITKDYFVHSMSILNRFQDSYEVLKKIQDFVS